ncbi:MAG: asparagine synthase (glutamine-hydrolyzing) [Fimbriimonadaceae bacterium]|nr:asparagine synthase (glutamine-hydrolyzing) [Fimbriimonadaceae bacterium]QYK57012.1 MAG: asparagine synthase (glutamine-hydrolyzing) [Fimbriimonadaceae bacterium]
MCGIAGYFVFRASGEKLGTEPLQAMCKCMAVRGPDGEGIWTSPSGSTGFGHRRLAIIDLSQNGSQPMSWPEEGLTITYNGEIYNYRELRSDLESRGHVFVSDSDTEVLLHLYSVYGREMCDKLRGMFALAIWDEKRQGLFIARDHFGIKPLYIARLQDKIVFSSQVKALLASNLVPTDPEPAGHVGFFLWGNVRGPFTLYKHIRELQPGKSLWVDQYGPREEVTFFSLPLEMGRAEGTAREKDPDAMRECLRVALLDSVRHHFVSDVPVSVFLSAGRDSATLLGLSTEVNRQPPTALTLAFQEYSGKPEDEAPLASKIAEHYGAPHILREVVGRDFRDDLSNIFEVMDQPSVDGANTYFVSKVSKESGIKVALSGLGADELFGGYPSFEQVPYIVSKLRRWKSIPVLGVWFRIVSGRIIPHFTSPKYAGLLEYGTSFPGAYLLRRGLYMPWELPSLLDPDMVRIGWSELQSLARLEETISPASSARTRMTLLETTWYMKNRLLRDSDWAGMAHSIEIRVPFVDVKLFRSMAPYFGTPAVPTKDDMARTPCNSLPDEVLNRPKSGFMIPVREWLQGQQQGGGERSLRGWARLIYNEFVKP